MADNFEDKNFPEGEEKKENNDNNEKKGWRDSIKDFVEWKYKEYTDRLKKGAVDSALDNLQANVEKWLNIDEADNKTKKELAEFFDKWKDELKIVDTEEEEQLVEKLTSNGKFFKGRDPEIVAKIEESASEIENEIKNWQSQGSTVARSLLRIVDWIMWTEK